MPRPSSPPPTTAFPLVDPRWLVKAFAFMLLICLLLAYATYAWLFWQGQWQLVLHPTTAISQTPAALSLPFEDVQFAADATGKPQLSGWWVPSATRTSETAILFHGADGAMDATLPRVLTLHAANLNVFVFDYRGYGLSPAPHPTQLSMQQDARSALQYVRTTRNILASQIILYGQGIGASLALNTCATTNIDCSTLIFENADGDLQPRVARDHRASFLPTRLFFHEDFPLAGLTTSQAAKLFLTTGTSTPPSFVQSAHDPKMSVELPQPNDPAIFPAIKRFLDDNPPHN